MLHTDFYKAAAQALAPLGVPLWLFGDAPTSPGPVYATYQAIGPGGRRWVFEGATDYARLQINLSALKSDPAALDKIGAAYAALDTLPKARRLGPPLPLPAADGDPYKTLRAEYEVTA